ncbi:hypothetical protein [Pseudoalteromonas luteoviolacea]|uniref:Uncharacterized protein n=1 Tax=Pseudoalteromonas luteoviolacea S4060-1 TaxID=1365257 RepID=A0A167KUS5_9GAMM|nr:hypothetical protein [Pseudoalteromonas luteoviolacea]KZN63307.1 hypothetical protein N478_03395 [Pseudoalteromonas luteoviolacea S4060-1]
MKRFYYSETGCFWICYISIKEIKNDKEMYEFMENSNDFGVDQDKSRSEDIMNLNIKAMTELVKH